MGVMWGGAMTVNLGVLCLAIYVLFGMVRRVSVHNFRFRPYLKYDRCEV